MESLKSYLVEHKEMDRDVFSKKYPKFWRAVSQFCRDKNTEEGVDYLIAAWTDSNTFNKYYKNSNVFSNKELQEFEEKYLDDECLAEIQ